MKVLPLKTIFFSNAPLKIISLFLGYSFWYIATINQPTTLTTTIPLCFGQLSSNYIIDAPETISVTLQGRRADLYTLDTNLLAAHVNINKLLPGKHGIVLKDHHLFLPHTITLQKYSPSPLSVTIIHSSTQD